jgi:hypothetical protein
MKKAFFSLAKGEALVRGISKDFTSLGRRHKYETM